MSSLLTWDFFIHPSLCQLSTILSSWQLLEAETYDNSLGRRLEYSASNLQVFSSNFLGDYSPGDYKPKTSPTSQHAFLSAYTKELLRKWVGRVGPLYIYPLFFPPELVISRLVMKIPVGWSIQSTDIRFVVFIAIFCLYNAVSPFKPSHVFMSWCLQRASICKRYNFHYTIINCI